MKFRTIGVFTLAALVAAMPAPRAQPESSAPSLLTPDIRTSANRKNNPSLFLQTNLPGGVWMAGAQFSPDGTKIITYGVDRQTPPRATDKPPPPLGIVRVWDATTATPLFSLQGHNELVHAAFFSPDGTRLATQSADGMIILWSLDAGNQISVLAPEIPGLHSNETPNPELRKAQLESPFLLGFSKDGNTVLATQAKFITPDTIDLNMVRWDGATGQAKEKSALETHLPLAQLTSADFSLPGGRGAAIVPVVRDGKFIFRLYVANLDGASPAPLELKDVLGARIGDVSGDGKIAIVEDVDGGRVLEIRDAAQRLTAISGDRYAFGQVAFTPDGNRIASAGRGGAIEIYNLDDGKAVRVGESAHEGAIESMHFDSTGQKLLTTGKSDGQVFVMDLARPASLPPSRGLLALTQTKGASLDAKGRLRGATFLPEAQSQTNNLEFQVLEGVEGQLVSTRATQAGQVNTVTFSPDGSLAAATLVSEVKGRPRATGINVWETATGKPQALLPEARYGVNGAAFSPDGTQLASGGREGRATIWEARTGRVLYNIPRFGAGVADVAFAADSRRLFVGHEDGIIDTFDPARNMVTETWKDAETLSALQLSPDGKLLAAARLSYTETGGAVAVQVWETARGQILREFSLPCSETPRFTGMAFSSDSSLLAIAAANDRLGQAVSSQVQVWSIRDRTLRASLTEDSSLMLPLISEDGKSLLAVHGGWLKQWDLAALAPAN